jgi:hypothetical protein
MVPWFVILISQLRFRREHQQAMASHPFRSLLFPWANYLTMAFLVCVLIGMGINDESFIEISPLAEAENLINKGHHGEENHSDKERHPGFIVNSRPRQAGKSR